MIPVYDSLAKFYDRAFAPFERRFLDRWRSETLSLLPKNAVILEIGAGTGANFKHYPEFHRAASTEISLKMIQFAKQKTIGNDLIQADAQTLPFGENVFDAAFATLVFCSIPDPAAAFAELGRIVKPGGRVVLLEHVRPEGFAGMLFDLLNVITVALIDDHFNRRTADIAAACGLRVREIRKKAGGVVNLIICEVNEHER